jgi:hypothetical protein
MRRASLVAFIFLLLASASVAGTYRVRPDGSGDYPTIQDAINAAADGDSVILAPGTFTGPGNRNIDSLGKAIVITSRHGPDATTIDAEWATRAFYIHQGEGNGTVISNITISHGFGPGAVGGGMRCEGTSPALVDLVFWRNSGGGATLVNSNSTVVRCRFIENDAYIPPPGPQYFSGTALVIDHSDVHLIDSYFWRNQRLSTAEVAAVHGLNSTVSMVGNVVDSNGVGETEGAVNFTDCSVSVLGNVVTNNWSFEYSGILLERCTGDVRGKLVGTQYGQSQPGRHQSDRLGRRCVLQLSS